LFSFEISHMPAPTIDKQPVACNASGITQIAHHNAHVRHFVLDKPPIHLLHFDLASIDSASPGPFIEQARATADHQAPQSKSDHNP
jgi:hypothetical protein